MAAAVAINLERIAGVTNTVIPLSMIGFGLLGHYVSFYFHFATVASGLLCGLNLYYRFGQRQHALLRNFGVLAQARYITEAIGPELRQYLFAGDLTERPFNRLQRAEVYRKAKGVESSSAFGTQLNFDAGEVKLRHSMFPVTKDEIEPYRLVFGEERGIETAYTLRRPVVISAMSYGALSAPAVRALARGAKRAGAAMNTGEGGFPKYHLLEDCDLIFQMGTAKFGVRDEAGRLDESKLSALSGRPQVKMVEIKLSQGAKPGKGGLLPKEKINEEIAALRGVPMGRDVISPSAHPECSTPQATVAFIRRVQEVSGLPVGIKLCLGHPSQFDALVQAMKAQQVFPDYVSIDGGEGGTGAAPKGFMDYFGLPLLHALPTVHQLLVAEGCRDRLKLMAAGKLIDPARQCVALCLGADAVYTARGFMFALGCIQALQCNANTCPVGITTHKPELIRGLDIDEKAARVASYMKGLERDHLEMLAALGCRSYGELSEAHLYAPSLTLLSDHGPYGDQEAVLGVHGRSTEVVMS